jgi:hypothetical protein
MAAPIRFLGELRGHIRIGRWSATRCIGLVHASPLRFRKRNWSDLWGPSKSRPRPCEPLKNSRKKFRKKFRKNSLSKKSPGSFPHRMRLIRFCVFLARRLFRVASRSICPERSKKMLIHANILASARRRNSWCDRLRVRTWDYPGAACCGARPGIDLVRRDPWQRGVAVKIP